LKWEQNLVENQYDYRFTVMHTHLVSTTTPLFLQSQPMGLQMTLAQQRERRLLVFEKKHNNNAHQNENECNCLVHE